MKFSLGKSTKRYSHDMSYRVNTTSDFGSVQPILCQFLNTGDKASMKDFRQLVRNAVMPSPTFGEIKCINNFQFVPISDVYPAYDALLSRQSVSTSVRSYVPISVPTVNSSALVILLMAREFSDCVVFQSVVKEVVDDKAPTGKRSAEVFQIYEDNKVKFLDFMKAVSIFYGSSCSTVFNTFDPNLAGGSNLSMPNLVHAGVSPDSCDFLIKVGGRGHAEVFADLEKKGFTSSFSEFYFGIRLNARGKRLFKIFRGLGYSMDFMDTNPVSVLPILAFYKAWFDLYYPTRFLDFQSTECYSLINSLFNSGTVDIVDGSDGAVLFAFKRFLKSELSDCFYTYPDDFVSVHTDTPIGNVLSDDKEFISSGSPIPEQTNLKDSSQLKVTLEKSSVPFIDGNTNLTDTYLRFLSRITKFLNKNSLIGSRVADYIRVHYGSKVADGLFGVSNSVATFVTDVRLDDVYSQADTMDISKVSKGQPLGARAGIGQGFSNNSFSFEANTFGFLIGMTSIYPISTCCQGDDPQLYMLQRFDFPNPEFDALGYELTPRYCIYDAQGSSRPIDSDSDDSYLASFGFLPRYSKLKTKHSIINGDMQLRSTRDSFMSYHLDRYIIKDVVESSLALKEARRNFYFIANRNFDVPNASVQWRFMLKYPQLGFFNRIFMNSGELPNGIGVFMGSSQNPQQQSEVIVKYDSFRLDDNFTVQCNCSFYVSNCLKPLSQSYDTFDEEVDNATTSVSNV